MNHLQWGNQAIDRMDEDVPYQAPAVYAPPATLSFQQTQSTPSIMDTDNVQMSHPTNCPCETCRANRAQIIRAKYAQARRYG